MWFCSLIYIDPDTNEFKSTNLSKNNFCLYGFFQTLEEWLLLFNRAGYCVYNTYNNLYNHAVFEKIESDPTKTCVERIVYKYDETIHNFVITREPKSMKEHFMNGKAIAM